MHVRMSPKPHIFANLDKNSPYWGDRVEFTNEYEPIFMDDPDLDESLGQPDEILGVPLGVYRRCTSSLVDLLKARIAEMTKAKDDAGVKRLSELCESIRSRIDKTVT